MIPLRDINPSRRLPWMTLFFIALNVLVFFFELSLDAGSLKRLFNTYGVVPGHALFFGRVEGFTFMNFITPYFTSMFLHGGWLHLIGNMWFLWIFGDNVEDRMGPFLYFFFYLACGIAGGLLHTFFNIHSDIPSVGASGAISGVLGAYMLMYPGARIVTLVPVFFFIQIIELPALILIGIWFVLQVLNGGVLAQNAAGMASPVAWWAHVGGFAAGIVFLGIIGSRRRRR